MFATLLALLCQNLLGFHRMFPLLMQDSIRFSTFLALLHQKMFLGFSQDFPLMQNSPHSSQFWPHCAKNCWVFTGCSSSDASFYLFFHIFGPTALKGIFQIFASTGGTHTHQVPAKSVKFYRNSDLKQFLSVKLFFTYSKISPPEFIYVRQFFTYSEITTQNKNLCM